MFPLDAASVKTPLAISTVTNPCDVGVNVAEYEVPVPPKLLSVPFATVMSEIPKLDVDSDVAKDIVKVESSLVSPDSTSAAAIETVGAVVSGAYVHVN